jgi:dihydrofolate reductase
MSKVRVAAYGISVDGFGAGPNQSLENPLGEGFPEVMSWFFPTRMFRNMHGGGGAGGETGVDNSMAEKSFENLGSWILGRNMFGPVRGPWPNEDWRGWWGEEPPYHCQVFVLTHHARPVLRMKGTDFHFVTGGIHEALARAKEAAAGRDVRIGGGAATIRQYLEARLIDELHIAQRPVLMGRGEPLFAGLDLKALGYTIDKSVPGERATHLFLRRS